MKNTALSAIGRMTNNGEGFQMVVTFSPTPKGGVKVEKQMVEIENLKRINDIKPSKLTKISKINNRNKGKDSVLDNAFEYNRLSKLGWTQTDIAAKSGVTQANVSNGLLLSRMPANILTAVKSNYVAASLIIQMFRASGNDESKLTKAFGQALSEHPGEKITKSDIAEVFA